MKLNTSNRGGYAVLMFIIALIVIVVLGVIIYTIIKCAQLPTRRAPDPDDLVFEITTDPAVVEQYGFTVPKVTQFSSSLDAIPGMICTVERTTNFVDWEGLYSLEAGIDDQVIINDTNPPPDRAFYRLRFE